MTSESMKDVEFFTKRAKDLAGDLHHEARLERIVAIIERYFSSIWLDGFNEGFEQGSTPLEVVEAEPLPLEDATGTP
jgi:hypothetical protein